MRESRCLFRGQWMPWETFVKHMEMERKEAKNEPHEDSRDHHGPCCNHRDRVESGSPLGLPDGLRRTREILPTISGRAADRPDDRTYVVNGGPAEESTVQHGVEGTAKRTGGKKEAT